MTARPSSLAAGRAGLAPRVAGALLLLGLLPSSVGADSREEEAVTPLALVRSAEAVAIVRGEEPPAGAEAVLGRLRVEEVLRGTPPEGGAVTVAGRREVNDLRVHPGVRSVAFLRRAAGGRWEVLGDALGLVAVGDSVPGLPEPPTLAFLRLLVEEARPGAEISSPGRVRAALVSVAAGGESRFRAGAALDLLRERGLLTGATESERAALVQAFVAADNGARVKSHLVRILGVLRPEGAVRLLGDALVAPGAAALRPAAGRALADLGDPDAAAALAARAARGTAEARAAVAGALGWSGLASARGPLEGMLGAPEPAVRGEAAVALGRLRFAESAPALLRRFRGEPGGASPEGDDGVRRAVAWALAQVDAPEAWTALQEAAASEAESAAFRAHVRAVLENPRRSLVR